MTKPKRDRGEVGRETLVAEAWADCARIAEKEARKWRDARRENLRIGRLKDAVLCAVRMFEAEAIARAIRARRKPKEGRRG
jgi:hypothetical protein